MSLRTFLTLPGILIFGVVTALYIVFFKYELIRKLDFVALVEIVQDQKQIIDILPEAISLVFYVFIFKIIFL